MAGVTGLEPATSGVTGQRSNQLSYTPLLHARDRLKEGWEYLKEVGLMYGRLQALSTPPQEGRQAAQYRAGGRWWAATQPPAYLNPAAFLPGQFCARNHARPTLFMFLAESAVNALPSKFFKIFKPSRNPKNHS